MAEFYWAWVIVAAVLVGLAAFLGVRSQGDWRGILVDNRGRYSLTNFQMVAWSVVIIPLIAAVFWGRYRAGDPAGALEFEIPDQLLIVLGISLGSGAVSTAVKSSKDQLHPDRIAASNEEDRPRFAQMFLLEEGELADRVVDVAKFQNFLITLVLIVAYVVLAIDALGNAVDITKVESLPIFGTTFVTLLGISHAGYLAGKLPERPGEPDGLTLSKRREGAIPDLTTPGATNTKAGPGIPTYRPRNPAR